MARCTVQSREEKNAGWVGYIRVFLPTVPEALKHDPCRYAEVAAGLLGRQLPEPLRNYMWLDVLFKAERKRMPDG